MHFLALLSAFPIGQGWPDKVQWFPEHGRAFPHKGDKCFEKWLICEKSKLCIVKEGDIHFLPQFCISWGGVEEVSYLPGIPSLTLSKDLIELGDRELKD